MTTTAYGRIRNVSGENRLDLLGGDRLVLKNATVPVPLDQVTAYTQSETIWAPADEAAQAVHDEMLEAIAYLIELEAAEEQEAGVPAPDGSWPAAYPDAAAVVELTKAQELISDVVPGLDLDHAEALLDAENARPEPRKTVVVAAEKRIDDLTNTQEV